jgi:hypothetical protein
VSNVFDRLWDRQRDLQVGRLSWGCTPWPHTFLSATPLLCIHRFLVTQAKQNVTITVAVLSGAVSAFYGYR